MNLLAIAGKFRACADALDDLSVLLGGSVEQPPEVAVREIVERPNQPRNAKAKALPAPEANGNCKTHPWREPLKRKVSPSPRRQRIIDLLTKRGRLTTKQIMESLGEEYMPVWQCLQNGMGSGVFAQPAKGEWTVAEDVT